MHTWGDWWAAMLIAVGLVIIIAAALAPKRKEEPHDCPMCAQAARDGLFVCCKDCGKPLEAQLSSIGCTMCPSCYKAFEKAQEWHDRDALHAEGKR